MYGVPQTKGISNLKFEFLAVLSIISSSGHLLSKKRKKESIISAFELNQQERNQQTAVLAMISKC